MKGHISDEPKEYYHLTLCYLALQSIFQLTSPELKGEQEQ